MPFSDIASQMSPKISLDLLHQDGSNLIAECFHTEIIKLHYLTSKIATTSATTLIKYHIYPNVWTFLLITKLVL